MFVCCPSICLCVSLYFYLRITKYCKTSDEVVCMYCWRINLKTGACFILIWSLEPEKFTVFRTNYVAVRASYITTITLLRTFPKRNFHLQFFFSIVKQNSQGISRLFQVQQSQLPFRDVLRRIKGQHFL